MSGFFLASFFIFLSIIFFLLRSSSKNKINKSDEPKKSDNRNQKDEKPIKKEEKEEKEEKKDEEKIKKDITKYLFKTIKEGKNMTKCYFYNKGHFILFCDEKRLCLCYLKYFNSNTQKIYSKSIDKDTIVDICFSPLKKVVFCASKNSKSIIPYILEKKEGKIKLNKSEKIISCSRPYEIKAIVTNESGVLISSIGTNDDTEVQIHNTISTELEFKQSTGAISNFQILMGPNDSDLLISTFMNDISVINLEKNDKFNNETKQYENFYKFKRNASISGFKSKLLYYCLSNDEKFFAISGDDKTIKIFRNYGNISDSKFFSQISLNFKASVVSLYIDNFNNGRLSGYIGASEGNNAYVYDINGLTILELIDAHDSDIISLYITKDDLNRKESVDNKELKKDEDSKDGEICLISAGKDGRIKFWKIN